jgi:hypothetical protein
MSVETHQRNLLNMHPQMILSPRHAASVVPNTPIQQLDPADSEDELAKREVHERLNKLKMENSRVLYFAIYETI